MSQCPASASYPCTEETDAMKEGTLLHAAMAGDPSAIAALSEDQMEACHAADAEWVKAINDLGPGSTHNEIPVWIFREGQKVTWGTVDRLFLPNDHPNLAVICDWKFGRSEPISASTSVQLGLYAAAVSGEFLVDRVIAHVIAPRAFGERHTEYTFTEFYALVDNYLMFRKLAEVPKPQHIPGDWCRRCNGQAVCPALVSQSAELVRQDMPFPVDLMEPGKAVSLWKLAKQAEDWGKKVQTMIRKVVTAGTAVPGMEFVQMSGPRKITDTLAAWEATKDFVPQDEFLKATEIGVPSLESLYLAGLRKSTDRKVTAKEGKERFEAALAGVLKRSTRVVVRLAGGQNGDDTDAQEN